MPKHATPNGDSQDFFECNGYRGSQNADSDPTYLNFAPKQSATLGMKVFSIGYPISDLLGIEPKYTEGTISSLSGPADDASLLQISVPLEPGNSGGAVVNDNGQIVGIVNSTASLSVFLSLTGTVPQNIGWAVKGEYAAILIDDAPLLAIAKERSAVIQRVKTASCMIIASTRVP